MSYKTYEEYKDSGIEWVDAIPKDWDIIKAKHCFKLTGGYAFKSKDFIEEGVHLIRIGDIQNGTIDFNNCKKLPLEYATTMKEFIVKSNDVVIALTGATIGKIGQVPKTNKKLLLNQRVSKLTSNFSNYYKYVLSSDLIKKQISLIADGSAQENISNETIGEFKIFDIDNKTKKQIADYLDKRISVIDENIAKNKELILLLEEKKTALINQVVTKGLDPNVPMKDSGIEWIGEIPEHWKIMKMKFLGSARNGLTYKPQDISDVGTLVLRSSNIQEGKLSFEDNIYIKSVIDSKFIVKENDLLICSRNGSKHLIGKSALITSEVSGNTFGAFMMIFKSKYNPFIQYTLKSKIFAYYVDSFLTSTINQLTLQNFNNMAISITLDINEQKQISEYLNKETSKIDKTISKIEENVDLLEEYKSSLIHHVVTGKIDVRGEEI